MEEAFFKTVELEKRDAFFNKVTRKYYYLTENNYKSLAAHMKEEGGEYLFLYLCSFSSTKVPDLSEFDFIKGVSVGFSHMTNLSHIQDLHGIEELRLFNDATKTSLDFSNFPKLKLFEGGDRRNLHKIWEVPTLKHVLIEHFKDRHAVEGPALNSLTLLRLMNSRVTDLSFLKNNATNLKEIELRGVSQITNLDFLEGLEQLMHLHIDGNRLADFSGIKYATNLEWCGIESMCGMGKGDGFLGLKKLKFLGMSGHKNLLQLVKEIQLRLNLDPIKYRDLRPKPETE